MISNVERIYVCDRINKFVNRYEKLKQWDRKEHVRLYGNSDGRDNERWNFSDTELRLVNQLKSIEDAIHMYPSGGIAVTIAAEHMQMLTAIWNRDEPERADRARRIINMTRATYGT